MNKELGVFKDGGMYQKKKMVAYTVPNEKMWLEFYFPIMAKCHNEE